MTYNANKGKEVTTQQSKLEKNKLYDTVIVSIQDGKVNDFLADKVKKDWKGDLDGNAINVIYQLPISDTEHEDLSQIFTYNVGDDGSVEYSSSSNMAKYATQYGKLPEVGDKIKVLTNAQGKPKILLP